jgi:hypothetical protein
MELLAPYNAHYVNDIQCGLAPLHIACKYRCFDIAEFLLSCPGIDAGLENAYRVLFCFIKMCSIFSRGINLADFWHGSRMKDSLMYLSVTSAGFFSFTLESTSFRSQQGIT